MPSLEDIIASLPSSSRSNLTLSNLTYRVLSNVIIDVQAHGLPVKSTLPGILQSICTDVIQPLNISSLMRKIKSLKEKEMMSGKFTLMDQPATEVQPKCEIIGETWPGS
ncbi:uncharacterized protein LOC144448551 [Glandiceps talaboti]